MTRRIIEHTADVRLRVEGASLEELFREAMVGMFEIMERRLQRAGSPAEAGAPLHVEIHSPDRTSLLVDFLNEVLSRAHIARESFDGVKFDRLTETEAAATLTGRTPARFEQDVKAVTYHEAEVRCENGVWSTMLVFDI